MRALCGAIITAGALIGLGLTALGFGERFQSVPEKHTGTFENVYYGAPSMTLVLVLLIIGLFIGVAITFLGLMFHHHRRHLEHLNRTSHGDAATRMPV